MAFSFGNTVSAQKFTKVKGKVLDAQTKEPLPFVNISFLGTNVGMTTDFDGFYNLQSKWASDTLQVSYIGYDTQKIPLTQGEAQVINVALKESGGLFLETVTITAKKKKYRKKNNPAVDLIRNVIANKERNRIKGQDYFEYDKYEKVQMDLNNITDKFRSRKVFKNFQFIFDNVDTSKINGKPYLPVYIQETKSKVYFSKNPHADKEFREGVKQSGLDEYWDDEGISALTDALYQDIDIYDKEITIIDIPFTGPLSPIAPDFYRFYIIDTVEVGGRQCINLAFMPRNKQNFGFVGDLYITVDTNYTVVKADLGITKRINMNWVDDLQIIQEFSFADSVWLLTEDKIIIDFKINKKGVGFYGRKSNIYKNHVFNVKRDDKYYAGAERIIDVDKDVFDKDLTYWQSARPVPLNEKEQTIYNMVDTIQTIPAFRNSLDILNLLLTGYWTFGGVDIGPVNGFYNYNPVQGSTFRLGGETNTTFHKKIKLEGQAVYTPKEEIFRGSAAAVYSFNEDFEMNPRHEVRFAYQRGTNFPGLSLNFVNEDNVLLSIRRGVIDKLIDYELYRFNYLREQTNSFSTELTFERRNQKPLGPYFRFTYGDGTDLPSINTTEVGVKLRWAPNEQFVQARDYRYTIYNKYPVFTLNYTAGLKNVLGGDYNYHRTTLNIFKKWNFSILGYAHMNFEVGKVFGSELPFMLMFLPRANQTYSYQSFSYNMMNFLEFAHDEYASLNVRYYFNGFIFNKIPLLRRLKFREIVSFKALYGRISDKNNPTLEGTEDFIKFPVDANGEDATFILDKYPYMEASVGISNIFKVLTIDFVKRLNYLDNPSTPSLFGVRGLGIRFRVGVEF
ncbi:MAG: hypothetical protein ACI81W_003774 [Saprospiraceae bacterium]|jgi:hypothetical protein